MTHMTRHDVKCIAHHHGQVSRITPCEVMKFSNHCAAITCLAWHTMTPTVMYFDGVEWDVIDQGFMTSLLRCVASLSFVCGCVACHHVVSSCIVVSHVTLCHITTFCQTACLQRL